MRGASNRDAAMPETLAFAHHLADVADAISMRRFQRAGAVSTKADGSIVTDADLAVDEAIRSLIDAQDRGCRIISEESLPPGEPLPPAVPDGESWVLDPIDQTTNFARGIEEFATLIARCRYGSVECAVVSAPALGRRWWAVRGEGAFVASVKAGEQPGSTGAGRRLHVSGCSRLDEAVLSVAAVHRFAPDALQEEVLRLCGGTAALTGNGGFLAHMRIAEGTVDLAVDPWGQLWDLAASSLIVQEAGGFFGGLDGESGPRAGSALAGNHLLAQATTRRLAGRSEGGRDRVREIGSGDG